MWSWLEYCDVNIYVVDIKINLIVIIVLSGRIFIKVVVDDVLCWEYRRGYFFLL